MSFRIDDLKADISKHNGMSHPNRYSVIITPPAGADILNKARFAMNLEHLTLMCTSTTLPGRTIATSEYQSVTKTFKLPYTYINSDVSLTFYLTSDMAAKTLFEEWQALVIDFKHYRLRYHENYKGQMLIQQLDKDNNVSYFSVLKDCYPIDVSAVELDNTQENVIQTITVQMAYTDFYSAHELIRSVV